jgi:Asp-tRNA(Asn)/Glu-tRNA(Gln) amidotransferase A subunit family amidase
MTGIAEYERLDAMGLAALIAGRDVTALELLDEAMARADRFNPTINAITIRLYERARDAARTTHSKGPFAGVPFLLKDLGALLTGTVSTGSTKLCAEVVADHDSTIVTRHLAAGLNIFGRRRRSAYPADGACDRWRRVDPHPRLLLRPVRSEADTCAQSERPGCG